MKHSNIFTEFSLTDTTALWLILTLCVLAITLTIPAIWKMKRRLWIIGGAIVLWLILWVLYNCVFKPFNVALPWHVFCTFAVIPLVALAIRARIKRTIGAVLLAIIAFIGSLNHAFALYPTIGDFNKPEPVVEVKSENLDDLKTAPTKDGISVGVVIRETIPGDASGFKARKSTIYLPPAHFRAFELPVLVLLAGVPGDPDDWFHYMHIEEIMERYQHEHHGIAPIVIATDFTGSFTGDMGCVDSPEAKIQTYLKQDVPAYAIKRFHANPDMTKWTIGGVSSGGTCALQTALNEPVEYTNFVDIAGELFPDVGKHSTTVQKFYEGSEANFQQKNPSSIMYRKEPRISSISGRFLVGAGDREFKTYMKRLYEISTQTNMHTEYLETSGAHNTEAWREGIRSSLDFIVKQGGIDLDE